MTFKLQHVHALLLGPEQIDRFVFGTVLHNQYQTLISAMEGCSQTSKYETIEVHGLCTP